MDSSWRRRWGRTIANNLRSRFQYLRGLRRHYVVIPSLGVGYGRIPKAANSTIKRHLARLAGIEDLFGPDGTSKDKHWRSKAPKAYFMTAKEARRTFPKIVLFSFVRHPLSRLASCYRSKIVKPDHIRGGLVHEGLNTSTSFAEFVHHVAARPDWQSNIHYRSQSHILSMCKENAPDFIGRIETMQTDWLRLSGQVEKMGWPAIAGIAKRTGQKPSGSMHYHELYLKDDGLIETARLRYADDLRLFYPNDDDVSSPIRART